MRLFIQTIKYMGISALVLVILFPMYLINLEVGVSHKKSKRLPTWISIAGKHINSIEHEIKELYDSRFGNLKTAENDQKLSRGLQIDWWFNVCFERTTWDRTWHPLFPFFPQKTTTTFKAVEDERTVGNFLRKISGFIYTNTSAFYEFKLLSRDGAEMLLLDTETIFQHESQSCPSFESAKEILYLTLTRREMDIQDQKISLQEMFSTHSSKLWLESRKLYYVEIIQGGKHFTKCQLHWRTGQEEFKILEKENLLSAKGMPRFSPLMQRTQVHQKYPSTQSKIRRNSFHKIPILQASSKIKASSYKCKPLVSRPKNISKLYDGYMKYIYQKHTAVFPQEYYELTSNTVHERIVLNEGFAKNLTRKTFDQLNNLYDGKLVLEDIVHVQENSKYKDEKTEWQKGYYFVEMDVKMKTGDGQSKTYRSSQYVQLSPDGICFVSDYEWKEKVQINLITPIQNQKTWLLYLIQMLEKLQEKTNEKNINLVIVDSHSTDGDYESILNASQLPHQYLRMSDRKFSKVKALNYGLNHVKNSNSIVFVLDLHLQLPLNIFDRIRKLTIEGKTAFTPVLMKLGCGEHEQYTPLNISLWLDSGVGMMAMYKSDWMKIGGFNEKLFKNKWGGEDWEVIDRVVGKGLYIIQCRLPDFYHIHHDKVGMWGGKQFKNNNFHF